MTAAQSSMPATASLVASLRAFASSSSALRVLHTCPSTSANLIHPRTLYVLDSSFNPPTFAHLRICLSALRDDTRRRSGPFRLLLLLATQNADKPPKPAAFEHRLSMMGLLAEQIQISLQEQHHTEDEVPVDVAVCKPPLFIDKMRAIAAEEMYAEDTEQVHLIGFDTLIRLLDPKYYPPRHDLSPLSALFDKHRVRVTKRVTDDSDEAAQLEYVQRIANGDREQEGCRREWADKIELVEGRKASEEAISSTKVRNAINEDDQESLIRLAPSNVIEFIHNERPYV